MTGPTRLELTFWHNPRCSKSRGALQILRETGIEPRLVEYLKTPPDAAEVRRVLALLGRTPRELIRTGEPVYRELGLDDLKRTDEELIDAMAAHPILIERPIVIGPDAAVIGRPPERVRDLIGND